MRLAMLFYFQTKRLHATKPKSCNNRGFSEEEFQRRSFNIATGRQSALLVTPSALSSLLIPLKHSNPTLPAITLITALAVRSYF